MIRIRVITQQSILIIFLISNLANPLLALPTKTRTTIKRNQQVLVFFNKIKNTLIQKGLEEEIALNKVQKLLNAHNTTLEKLKHFHENSKLYFKKEKLIETLALYALHEKELDLNSYGASIGFSQSVLGRPLHSEELEYLQDLQG